MSRLLIFRIKKSVKGLFTTQYCKDVTDISLIYKQGHLFTLMPDVAHRYSLTYRQICPYKASYDIVKDLVSKNHLYLLRAFSHIDAHNFLYIILYTLCFSSDENIDKNLSHFSVKNYDYIMLTNTTLTFNGYPIGNFYKNLEFLRNRIKLHPTVWRDVSSFASAIEQTQNFLDGYVSNTPWPNLDNKNQTDRSMLKLTHHGFLGISYRENVDTEPIKQRALLEGYIHKNNSNRLISRLLKTKKVIIYRDKFDETIFGLDEQNIEIPLTDTTISFQRSIGLKTLSSAGLKLKSAIVREAHYIAIIMKDTADSQLINLVLKNL